MEINFENKSFIFKLGKFCKNIDSKVSELKKKNENIPGSTPQNYDKGLKKFNLELQKLKLLSEDTKYKIGEIEQFSFFTASLQKIVSQQEDEIMKMESYLKKFGYVVPEILATLNEISPVPDEQDNMLDDDQINHFSKVENGLLMTPELSDVGKLALQGKRLPILEILTIVPNTGKSHDVTVTDDSSPTCTHSIAYEATPTSLSAQNIQKWLERVHAEANFAITPNVITERPVKSLRRQQAGGDFSKDKDNVTSNRLLGSRNGLLQRSRFESLSLKYETCDSATENVGYKLEQKSLFLPQESQSKRFASDEPVLSAARNLSIKKDYLTPEEPILISKVLSLHNGSDAQRLTPELPILSYARNPSMKEDYPTPEEPFLSSLNKTTIKNGNDEVEEEYTPEKPSINCGREPYKTANNAARLINTPQSPQLSDVTQKYLNIRNLHLNRLDLDLSLPDKNHLPTKVNNSKRALETCDLSTEKNIDNKFEQKSHFLPKESQSKHFTPEEPVLFTARNLNIKKDYITPEEPTLNSTVHFLHEASNAERFTPESPILSIARNLGIKKDFPTPEEPVLSSLNNIQCLQEWQ